MATPTASEALLHPAFPSPLQRERLAFCPTLPGALSGAHGVDVTEDHPTSAAGDVDAIRAQFPVLFGRPSVKVTAAPAEFDSHSSSNAAAAPPRFGVVLSGGQAPGGHNVIAGLYDFAKSRGGSVVGFLNGPRGIFTSGQTIILDDARVDRYRNMGGFDIIGSGRDKIHSAEQFQNSLAHCQALKLDGLVVIGGDDSNTNACMLAEYFAAQGSSCRVVGCPKTIDNDLKNEHVPVSFGFDTACRVYSELIGSVALDALSSRKKYHFVRLMGRSASHIALECALQTRPNLCWIGEEVQHRQMTLAQVTMQLVDLFIARAKEDKYYGVVLVPEGLIEFIPELGLLISELNDVLAGLDASGPPPTVEALAPKLGANNAALLRFLPPAIASQLLLERDSHGNVAVSLIETERLIMACAEQELRKRPSSEFDCGRLQTQFHFFGYEGRSAMPSVFDSNYCYALGFNAGALLSKPGVTGVISTVSNLRAPPSEWTCGGMPLTHMMNMERRAGKDKPVIKKALTELEGKPFSEFARLRDGWRLSDDYRTPGPIQFQGPAASAISETLRLELEQREEAAAGGDANGGPAKKQKSSASSSSSDSSSSASITSRARAAHRARTPFHNTLTPFLKPGAGIRRGVAAARSMQRLFPNLFPKENATNMTPPLVEPVDQPHTDAFTGYKAGPLRVGVVFCGRQCSAGHSVLAGILEGLGKQGAGSVLLGAEGGTVGMLKGAWREIKAEDLARGAFRNQGGFHLLGRSVDQMCGSPDQLSAIAAECAKQRLDGLVCVGGTYTARDAAVLAEYLKATQSGSANSTSVVSVPATIDGDMMGDFVEATVGFHTTSHMCAQLVGNIASDCNSAKKYYYWIRMMGRRPSHVAVEVALQTCPNAVLIGEQIQSDRTTLAALVGHVADLVCARARVGKNYGVILVPEGLLTFIPEMEGLLRDLQEALEGSQETVVSSLSSTESRRDAILRRLSPWNRALFDYLPEVIQGELLLSREIHGTLQLSQIETEKMMMELVGRELARRKRIGEYTGTYKTMTHFFGYQTRCGFPSEFDCSLGETLGHLSVSLVAHNCTGYLASCRNLNAMSPDQWQPVGVPLVGLLQTATNDGTPYFPPSLVDVTGDSGSPFGVLCKCLQTWEGSECYRNPGPIQFEGCTRWQRPLTLTYRDDGYIRRVEELQATLSSVSAACQLGLSGLGVKVALAQAKALQQTVDALAE